MLQYPTGSTGRPPGHVRTPSDFEYWFRDECFNRSLDEPDLMILELPGTTHPGILVPRARTLARWSYLSITLEWTLIATAGHGFAPDRYSFDFRNGYTDELIARYDYHEGHYTIGLAHVHFDDPEDGPLHAAEVTFFEAYDAVMDYAERFGVIRP